MAPHSEETRMVVKNAPGAQITSLTYGAPSHSTARTKKDRNTQSPDSWIRDFISQIERDVLGDSDRPPSCDQSTPKH